MKNKQALIDFFEKDDEMMDNYLIIKLKAISINEKVARNIVASFLLELNPSIEELSDVKTAVSEAITNSIVHGYSRSCGEIILTAKLKADRLYIKIEDFGIGIDDISQAMQPFFTTGPEGERSGMGFTVMETFMDELRVTNQPNSKGVVVEMAKEIKSSEK